MGEAIQTVGSLAGICGHDGTAWRKLGIVWGYNATVSEAKENLALAAGSNTITSTAVPAGEVWVISVAGILYVGTVPTWVELRATVGGVLMPYFHQDAPISGIWYTSPTPITLAVGDTLAASVAGATLNNDMYFRYYGYKMLLDM